MLKVIQFKLQVCVVIRDWKTPQKQLDCVRKAQTSAKASNLKPQPTVIRDLDPDFQINPDSDTDICRITSEMLWIRYLGVSHFAECREICW